MQKKPKLQMSLDFISLPPAIATAVRVSDYVDIIEIGTPLCKAAGLGAIEGICEVCPDTPVLADFKSPDGGGKEAKMAFEAGARYITVMGATELATASSAQKIAKEYGKEVLIELTGVKNPLDMADVWDDLGIERLVYQRGVDEEKVDRRKWTSKDFENIQSLQDMGFKITISGGVTSDLIHEFSHLSPSIIACGRAIYQSDDPASAARNIQKSISKIWGD